MGDQPARQNAPLVVGLGRISVALTGLAPDRPQSGARATELAALSATPARGISLALRAAQRLGCRARAAGTHGADLLGQLARAALQDVAIDCEYLRATGTTSCDF